MFDKESKTGNPIDSTKIKEAGSKQEYSQDNRARESFFRDLKKASKKQNQPSQRDQEKR